MKIREKGKEKNLAGLMVKEVSTGKIYLVINSRSHFAEGTYDLLDIADCRAFGEEFSRKEIVLNFELIGQAEIVYEGL